MSKARKWCSDHCSTEYARNHSWNYARWYAAGQNRLGWKQPGPCAHCHEEITGTPEVNHIDPRYGRGYGDGCWNHQENLEVLDHACHVAVTAVQRAARKTGGQVEMKMESEA